MKWGKLEELITRNWREKIISLVLAFLFWFMIKAQDARHPVPYAPPQPVKMTPQTFAPPVLTPTVEPSPEVPVKLTPTLPATPSIEVKEEPKPKPAGEAAKSTGL